MPSPFPGMDPYLEGEMWQEFHETLANTLRAHLMARLPSKYVALLAKRYVLERADLGIVGLDIPRVFYPDVHVAHTTAPGMLREGDGAAVLTAPAAELASPMLEEIPLLSVEIRDVAQRRLVTLIEILSPANKSAEGAREYDERRIDILQTRTHLLEIDLLRDGERVRLRGKYPPGAYYVLLSRSNRRPYTEIWPIALSDILPVVPVPLLAPDADVPLDLQAAIRACFDLVHYERLLDYTKPPPPPLTERESAWVAQCVRRAG